MSTRSTVGLIITADLKKKGKRICGGGAKQSDFIWSFYCVKNNIKSGSQQQCILLAISLGSGYVGMLIECWILFKYMFPI